MADLIARSAPNAPFATGAWFAPLMRARLESIVAIVVAGRPEGERVRDTTDPIL